MADSNCRLMYIDKCSSISLHHHHQATPTLGTNYVASGKWQKKIAEAENKMFPSRSTKIIIKIDGTLCRIYNLTDCFLTKIVR